MRPDAEREFIDIVYGAVGEPGYWQRAATAFSKTVEGGVAQISAYGPHVTDVHFYAVPDFVPQDTVDDYTNRYIDEDPRMAAAAGRTGRMIGCHEYMDVEAFERTAIVNEFLDRKAMNLRWCAAHIENLGGGATMLVSMMRPRDRGHFEKRELRTLERLSHHLHRAARLHIDLARSELASARFETTLDRLADAVFVCDRDGRILHMNEAGASLIGRGDTLRAIRGTLRPAAAEAGMAFVRAAYAAADPLLGETARPSLALRGPEGTLPLLARFHTLPPGLGPDLRNMRGEVLIVIRDPNLPARHDETALRALGFTPAETALTLALADGRTLAEHAADRGVTLETVRSQLKGAMSKAGVSRQAELVRLAMRYAG
ncbi:MAG: helix-turn-helix transcriptional regulator [Parvibaculum sp.]|nr:helix-turn-helix transcriptional regulator [Parvibaculum sp.]